LVLVDMPVAGLEEDTEAETDCEDECELCAPGVVGVDRTEGSETGSGVVSCLRTRLKVADGAWGVLSDTLGTLLAEPVAKPALVVVVVVLEKVVVEDGGERGDAAPDEEGRALGSRPVALCSACSTIFATSAGDNGVLPKRDPMVFTSEVNNPVRLERSWRTASELTRSESTAGAP